MRTAVTAVVGEPSLFAAMAALPRPVVLTDQVQAGTSMCSTMAMGAAEDSPYVILVDARHVRRQKHLEIAPSP